MRGSILLLLLASSLMTFALKIQISLYSADFITKIVNIKAREPLNIVLFYPKEVKGYLLGFRNSPSSNAILCVNSTEKAVVQVSLRLDMSSSRDVTFRVFTLPALPNEKICVPLVLFTPNAEESLRRLLGVVKVIKASAALQTGDLTSIFSVISGLLEFFSETRGIYLDATVEDVHGNRAYISHYFYERKIDGRGNECVKLRVLTKLPAAPNSIIKVSLNNTCNSYFKVNFYADVALDSDVFLKSVTLPPHGHLAVNIKVPEMFGVEHRYLSYQSHFIRDVKVTDNKGNVLYSIPVFDYVLFYIRYNMKARWDLERGVVCTKLSDIYPDLNFNETTFKLVVVKDIMFLPDKIVGKRELLVKSLKDFNDVCINFDNETSSLTRGFKLVLISPDGNDYLIDEVKLYR